MESTIDYFKDLKTTLERTAREPVFRQIAARFEDYISVHNPPGGSRLPDIRRVAEEFGVSIRTADLALQQLIERGICYRRPKKGTFVAAPVSPSFRICGLINQGPEPGAFADKDVTGPIYTGMTAEARKWNFDILSLSPERLDGYCANREIELAGVLLLYWNNREEILDLVRSHPELYFLFVNYDPGQLEPTASNIGAVFNDEFAGGFELAGAFAARGHRHFGIFNLELADCNYQLRKAGFCEALHSFGVNPLDIHIEAPLPGNYTIEQQFRLGEELAEHHFRRHPETTALLCVNDLLATGAAHYLERSNRRDRVEISGYDNILPHLSENHHFSTMEIDFRAMGVQAIHLLARHTTPDAPHILRVPPRPVFRFGKFNHNGGRR